MMEGRRSSSYPKETVLLSTQSIPSRCNGEVEADSDTFKLKMSWTGEWSDAVAMVAACAAALGGDAEAKMLAQRDAIAGAFVVSKDGPPTVRFIWEKLDHFLDHVERGRRRRLTRERAAGRRAAEEAAPPKRSRSRSGKTSWSRSPGRRANTCCMEHSSSRRSSSVRSHEPGCESI
jgi:hypothetical protein